MIYNITYLSPRDLKPEVKFDLGSKKTFGGQVTESSIRLDHNIAVRPKMNVIRENSNPPKSFVFVPIIWSLISLNG